MKKRRLTQFGTTVYSINYIKLGVIIYCGVYLGISILILNVVFLSPENNLPGLVFYRRSTKYEIIYVVQ